MNFNVTLRCLSGDWIFSQVMAVFSAAAGRGFNVSESSWGEHAGVAPNITESFLHLKFTGYFTTIGLLFFVSCFLFFHVSFIYFIQTCDGAADAGLEFFSQGPSARHQPLAEGPQC